MEVDLLWPVLDDQWALVTREAADACEYFSRPPD